MIFIIPLVLLLFFTNTKAEEKTLRPIVIFGDNTDQVDRGFTGQTVNKKELELHQYTDVNRALKKVSGVYVREEEGLGLRPNIGLRGTNPDRSKKIVFLEDDVLIGPAPYSAPAAYYTPSMNHTERLEIFKGFSSTGIGPNSVGGAINYISSKIHESSILNSVNFSLGAFNTVNGKISSSGPLNFKKQSYGSYLIEASHLFTEGFKKVDGDSNTDVLKSEILGKFKWSLAKGDLAQDVELKVGASWEDSNETYLGLSDEDFKNSPFRRYSASALDNMNWNHQKYQIRHTWQISETGLIENVAYRHDFNRTWNRLDRFRDGAASRSLQNILNNPTSEPLFYDILRGELDSAVVGTNGQLFLANNKREFFSQGLQSKYTDEFHFKKSQIKIEPEVFLRAHQDQIFRDQTSNNYDMFEGQLEAVGDLEQQTNLETQKSMAFTISSSSKVTYKSWILNPVLRLESVDYDFTNRLNTSANASRNFSAFVPGLSVFKRATPSLSLGVSYNKAASLAGVSASGDEVEETADNYEFLIKYLNQNYLLQFDSTFFYTDYQNITGTCTVSGGCISGSGEAFNGGQALIYGVEGGLSKGFFINNVYIPIGLNFTYLNASFNSDFTSQSPEWGQGDVKKGDPLPYIPEFQYSISVGADYKKLSHELMWTSQSKVFDQSVEANRIQIDDFQFLDFVGSYKYSSVLSLNYKVTNVFDTDYVVAARPFGLRPGMPRAYQLGFKYTF